MQNQSELLLFVLCCSLRVAAIAHGQYLDCVGVRALFLRLRCPACESGTEAPGIRHNKACRKRFSEFEEQRRKERRELSPESSVVVLQVEVPVEEVDDAPG